MRRWAHGRLPWYAREFGDTSDLVQDVMLQTVKSLAGFDPKGEGAFYAYLRRAVLNRICDAVRRAGRRPLHDAFPEEPADRGPSPIEQAVGAELLARYETALAKLKPSERDLILARVDLGVTHQELADVLGKRSANAARMALERALIRLAAEMAELAKPVHARSESGDARF